MLYFYTNWKRQKKHVVWKYSSLIENNILLIFTCSKSTIETLDEKREICLKLTIKTPERCQLRRSTVFIVNFEHISHPFLVFLLLTLNK